MITHTPTARQWHGDQRGWRWALTFAAVGAALVLLACGDRPARADGAWLDGQALATWNEAGATIPRVPRDPIISCPPQGRAPQTEEDRQVEAAGWVLVGAFQGGYGLMVVTGATTVDETCRLLGFQTFAFFLGNYIGTLSPELMDAARDGALKEVMFGAPRNDGPGPDGLPTLRATFDRYVAGDLACCPSYTAWLPYTLTNTGTGWVLTPGAVITTANQ